MRIALLFILSTFFVLSANAQIVNIPDANFKNALLNHNPVINTNNDGEIQVSEAVAFAGTMNVLSKNIADLTGINAFTNLTKLYCASNLLTNLNIVGLNSLNTLLCGSNRLSSLSLNNLPALQVLGCEQNSILSSLQLNNLPQLQSIAAAYNSFTSLNFSGFPSLRQIGVGSNSLLTNLVVDNLPNLKNLSCNGCKLSNLTLTNLPLLDTLFCTDNKLTSLTIPNPANLKVLAATGNLLTSLPAGLTSLKYLDVSRNQISNFPLDNMNLLQFAYVSYNLCNSLSLTNKPALKFIRCDNNLISNLQLSNLPSLESLDCRNNQLASVTLNGYNLLEEIRFDYNQLTSLTLGNLPSMKYLTCDGNKLATLTLSNYPLFSNLNCAGNQITNLSLNNLPNLYSLYCNNNLLTSLPFLTPGSFPALRFLDITGNRITRLVLENLASLGVLGCSDNPIDSLRLKNLPALNSMRIEKNKLTSLILDTLPNLRVLYCGKSDSLRNISLQLPRVSNFFCDSANIISLDISHTEAQEVQVTNNPLLQYINMRNNVSSIYNVIKFSNNNMLQFICVDSGEKARVIDSVLRQLPGQGIVVSTVCNFTPATSSTIKGTLRFDLNANGCDNTDSTMANVRINNSDGIYSTSAFTNSLGQYIFHTSANRDTVNVALGQPSWFNVSPPQHIINIPNPGITAIANFCVSPVGNHPDVDISIIAVTRARPGVDATYRIIYSNKGNTLQSGTFYVNFNTSKLSFVSATVPPASQAGNTINWNYVNLYPFQTRSVEVTFRVALPPIANGGDVLTFSGTINPVNGDETPGDNHTRFVQTIVNSYDPNDKEVGEGSSVDISQAGEYLHYTIHFQNEGSADAIKVLIKDSLTNNLNWNSFVPMAASHSFTANMPKGNVVEFVFDNINLPPKSVNEAASQGFAAFKVKPKSTIVVGEIINNRAEIYFDFNQPIITNTVITTIVTPKKSDNLIDLSVYSNPVKDEIRFTVKTGSQIKAINLYNTVGEKLYSETVNTAGTDRKVNITSIPTGLLFLEVITTGGTAVQKVMRIK